MKFSSASLTLRAIAILGVLSASQAGADHHPVIPTFERFYENLENPSEEDLLTGGRLLASELNCAGCHNNSDWQAESKKPPLLGEVAARVKPEYLKQFIANPHATKPGTTMPHMLESVAEGDRAKTAEALVHYLVSQSKQLPKPAFVPVGARERGDRVFHEVGCVACHGAKIEGSDQLPHAVPLGDIDSKYTVDSLTEFLLDPLHVRQSGRMPDLDLSPIDARGIAAYLIPSAPEKPGIQFAYFHGKWDKLPDFSKIEPFTQGSVESLDFSKFIKRKNNFGVVFTGLLEISDEGEYEFDLGSDDGSRLSIDGSVVVDNDGVHGFNRKNAKIQLTKGRHPAVIEFFEQAGEEKLEVKYRGPNLDWQDLASVLLSTTPTAELEEIKFSVDAELAKQGMSHFASLGCNQCHAMTESESASNSSFAGAARLHSAARDKGCLAESPSGKAPRYGLTAMQRKAINTVIAKGSVGGSDVVQSTMNRLNCAACHQRDGRGGLVDANNKHFTGTQPEMGDEGRIPPLLDGVGAKIKSDYLARMLAKGVKDRPYMRTKMPGFGAANTGTLSAALTKQDKLPTTLAKVALDRKEAKTAAWHMVGKKGFACIKCHTFGRFKATGVQSIDMTIMTKRLNEEWFRQYVRNPIAFRPGTRMPSAWPVTGASMLNKILDADSDKQIQAVWNYLGDGVRARVPAGLGTNTKELIPSTDAIIYRNFIEGAGPRAIAVGFPEGFHTAFDANELRLALIWQGAFIDASLHWNGRGQGFQPPLGDRVVKLPEGVGFAMLDDANESWPKLSARESGDYQFLGYSLTQDQRPTFKYRVGKYTIHDTPNAIDDGTRAALVRTITVNARKSTEASKLWYRAAAGEIERESQKRFRIGDLKITVDANSKLILRESENELIVELRPGMTLTQTYDW